MQTMLTVVTLRSAQAPKHAIKRNWSGPNKSPEAKEILKKASDLTGQGGKALLMFITAIWKTKRRTRHKALSID
jgi:hypothetical protein